MIDSAFLQHSLLVGFLLSLLLGAIVMVSLRINARLWLQDYPKPIRDKVPPLSPAEKRDRVIVSVVLIGVLFGGVILETLHLRSNQTEALTFGTAYLDIFIMLVIFNLFDALVLDLFIITLLKPRFVIIPGMEGMEHLFRDYKKQLTDFLKGMAFCVITSLPFAIAAII